VTAFGKMGPMPAHPARRRPDASSALSLSLALPGLVASLFVTSLAGRLLLPDLPWLVPAVWVLASAVLFVRPVELLVARLLFAMRRPTPAELYALDAGWSQVCRRAGTDPRRYVLLVQESAEPNAFAAGGRVVAVTRAALGLPDRHLEAVLAHELGHHLGAHPVVSRLGWWFALPARGAAYLLGHAFRFIRYAGRALATYGDALGALGALLIALILLAGLAFVSLWLILLPLISPFLAWASRLAEYRADRTAVRLGYGQELAAILHGWREPRPGLWARLLATHPPHPDRVARLR
jgi:Zn-dependent protease with chaperone function